MMGKSILIMRTVCVLGMVAMVALLGVILGCARPDAPETTPQPSTPVTQSTDQNMPRPRTPPEEEGVQAVAELVAEELKAPWALDFTPDGRIFITEKEGNIRVFANGELQDAPYLVIKEVAPEGEGGLLGLTVDPNFASNGLFYVYYSYKEASGALSNRVVRWRDTGQTAVNPTVILDGIPGDRIHNGGRLKFGPDGKLYVTIGDAASRILAQDISSLAGKILRINSDGAIPADNPIPGSPVYSYGHRNPQGLAWHPETGDLFATEHGPVGHDEVNLIVPGGNYGWPEVGGDETGEGFIPPVLHSGIETWAPSGAAFYDGDVMPAHWQGRLLFAALRGQRIVWVDFQEPDYQHVQRENSIFVRLHGRIRDVVLGPDGHLYFLTNNLDGRGRPREGDDLLLRIAPVAGVLSLHIP